MSNGSGPSVLERTLTFEAVRVTDAAAIAAAKWRGRGDERQADQAAIAAMRNELNRLPVRGRVVIGEGDDCEPPMLFVGETVGLGEGVALDIAVDPVEGVTLCAKANANALSVVALAEPDCLLHVPEMYMDKLAVGPGFEPGVIDLDLSPAENLARLAQAKGTPVSGLTVCILDRVRHSQLISEVRAAGAAIRLIRDGDIAGVIEASKTAETGIDIYMGIGGAAEGVLAAAALCSIGGQFQGRLTPLNDEQRRRAAALGITDLKQKYALDDMVRGNVIFAATGITDGTMLDGVKFNGKCVETHSIIMHSASKTVRRVRTRYDLARSAIASF
jgi:fructose-1,6-bisphosphatase II / sedoheptulose-1,7-bisphosphatase